MPTIPHSVTLDKSKCRGCTTCIKHCPTEAIRVRRGKATIISERCIDCGQCVLVCPYNAKKAVCDPFERLGDFDCTVALPAPSLYGQFHNLGDINIVLQGLLEIGFDRVYEVASAAETLSAMARRLLQSGTQRPVISAACPACVRLICQRFPKLMSHIAPDIAPVELAAIKAREEAARETGLPPERIGVFFITPCPAKVTAAHSPVGLEAPVMDGAFSMADIYVRLLPAMRRITSPAARVTAGLTGVGWASSGGEIAALPHIKSIAVDGIDNVAAILEDIEDDKLQDVDFIEIGACTQGCVGGCLTVENPFVSKMRIKEFAKKLPETAFPESHSTRELPVRTLPLEANPVHILDSDLGEAMDKYRRIEDLLSRLPGLDCSSCGAPSCRALAEDVVWGFAHEEDCIFYMRDKMNDETYLPPPFRKEIGTE